MICWRHEVIVSPAEGVGRFLHVSFLCYASGPMDVFLPKVWEGFLHVSFLCCTSEFREVSLPIVWGRSLGGFVHTR